MYIALRNLHTCLRGASFQAWPLVASGGAGTRDAILVEGALFEGLDDFPLPGVVHDVAGAPGRHVLVDQKLAHEPQQVLRSI